nr:MAG TPA: hypothetical protein [Caudoviricetes sp.]
MVRSSIRAHAICREAYQLACDAAHSSRTA